MREMRERERDEGERRDNNFDIEKEGDWGGVNKKGRREREGERRRETGREMEERKKQLELLSLNIMTAEYLRPRCHHSLLHCTHGLLCMSSFSIFILLPLNLGDFITTIILNIYLLL